jgi:hypothetical protein
MKSTDHGFDELTSLADKYGTDKGSSAHHYTEVYGHFFRGLKDKAVKLCEIGVGGGESLKMLADYFTKAELYGIDKLDASKLDSGRIHTFIADQSKRSDLQKFAAKHGDNYDIILDDGGHTMEQQQVSFGYLFKLVRPGGYYIIEDLQTSFRKEFPQFGANEDESNTTYTLLDNFVKSHTVKSMYMTREEEAYIESNIFYANILLLNGGRSISCIIKKKP